MADQKAPQMQATLGLTGLTSNAMALIAPGAFLWLTFLHPGHHRRCRPAIHRAGHVAGHLRRAAALPGHRRCLRRDLQALSRHRLQLLLRRAGHALQGQGLQVCPHRQVHRRLGLAPLLLGLSRRDGGGHRHLLRLCGRLPLSQLHERLQSRAGFHGLVAVVFSFFVAWIASKGAGASTAVNIAINVIQISALVVFSVLALGYRASHPSGTPALPVRCADAGHLHLSVRHQPKTAPPCATPAARRCRCSTAAGKPVPFTDHLSRPPTRPATSSPTPTPLRSSASHKFSCMFIQATVAILILVGFESVTSMGGEAKNPTKHIPIAVIASLLIQGLFCYLFEYFCANYFLNSGYTMQSAASFGCAHRRHDDHRRRCAARPGPRQVLHAG